MYHHLNRDKCYNKKGKPHDAWYFISLGSIFYIYLSAWILEWYSIPWWWVTNSGLLCLSFGHFLLVVVTLTYYLAAVTDPGNVPPNWKPENVSEEELEKAKLKPKTHIRNRYGDAVVWCKKCNNFKPPRTHHCKTCNRCVLRMDHHCVWINQCVGYKNHKHFILFLFYVNISLFYLNIMILHRILGTIIDLEDVPVLGIFDGVYLAFNLVFLFVFQPTAIIMFGSQLTQIARGITSIELWIKHWATYDFKEKGVEYIYPYDKGSYMENLKDFFGSSFLIWLVPTIPVESGYHDPHLMVLMKQHLHLLYPSEKKVEEV